MKTIIQINNNYIKGVAIILVVGIIILLGIFGYRQYQLSKIDSYDKCVAAGLPVLESYPAKCIVSGRTYTQTVSDTKDVTPEVTQPPPVAKENVIVEPISDSVSRITLKPFGIRVKPDNSPVQPEKFTGYHSGTDFEATKAEEDLMVPIKAICDGAVRFKGTVDGYGGLIITDCNINSQVVTVLYGHIDIASSTLVVGSTVTKNTFIANLAPGYSAGTSGERKHLHLGIHLGENIEYRGYVQNQSELSGWLNFQALFK